jgi:hypothetical protein
LTQDAYVGLGWFVFIFHPCCVTGPKNLNQPFFLWDASVLIVIVIRAKGFEIWALRQQRPTQGW